MKRIKDSIVDLHSKTIKKFRDLNKLLLKKQLDLNSKIIFD